MEPPIKPNGEAGVFESGSYSVECMDAAGEKASANFMISYNAALLEAKPAEVEGIIPAAYKRLAVYSDSNELLYFDAPKENWFEAEAVFKGVKNSCFYREVLSAGTVVCLMPKIYKDGEKSDESE